MVTVSFLIETSLVFFECVGRGNGTGESSGDSSGECLSDIRVAEIS
jgi:hypothetical protein